MVTCVQVFFCVDGGLVDEGGVGLTSPSVATSTLPIPGDPFALDFVLPAHCERRSFNVVSCMFAIQNVFRDEATAQHLVTSIAEYLEPGGVFLGTTVDAPVLQERLEASADGHTFGNGEYSVIFEGERCDISEENPFGHGCVRDASRQAVAKAASKAGRRGE